MQILDMFFNVAAGLFLLRLFLDEVSPNPFNPLFKLLHRITEPVLAPIRKILPFGLKDKLYIDISPIIAFLLIIALKVLTIKMLPILLLKPKVRPVKLK